MNKLKKRLQELQSEKHSLTSEVSTEEELASKLHKQLVEQSGA